MKTEELINMLSTNVEPVNRWRISLSLALALLIGGAVSFCVMLATVGPRTGFNIGFLLLKLVFALSLVFWGAALLVRLVRPGAKERKLFVLVSVPFLVAGVVGALVLILEPSARWRPMIIGSHWATCLYCIPLFAMIPFAALIWVLRKGAPVDLRRTGAIAGLVAGAIGAAVYAFHCADDSLPFVAVWYGLMIALCAWVGSRLGPWLLHW